MRQRLMLSNMEPLTAFKKSVFALVAWYLAVGFQMKDSGFDCDLHWNQRASQHFEFPTIEFVIAYTNSVFALVTW